MCFMHRPLRVTLFLACTTLAQQTSLNARVEQHLGGVSERAIELTLDRPFLVSVWWPVEFGERRLQVLKSFAGTWATVLDLLVEDLLYSFHDHHAFEARDVNKDGFPEVYLFSESVGSGAGSEMFTLVDAQNGRTYQSTISYEHGGSPGTVEVDPKLGRERADLLPWLEGKIAMSEVIKDRRSTEFKARDAWDVQNSAYQKVRGWRVTPVALPLSSWACQEKGGPFEPRQVLVKGDWRYIYWNRYGLVREKTAGGKCELVFSENDREDLRVLKWSGETLLVESAHSKGAVLLKFNTRTLELDVP